jgi:hypothetical protein
LIRPLSISTKAAKNNRRSLDFARDDSFEVMHIFWAGSIDMACQESFALEHVGQYSFEVFRAETAYSALPKIADRPAEAAQFAVI